MDGAINGIDRGGRRRVVILSAVDDVVSEIRMACAEVAERARHVRIDPDAIPTYATSLPLDAPPAVPDPDAHLVSGPAEELAAFWVTLNAINFGSGWFPTLRKRSWRSGYFTVAAGVRDRFAARGPWAADELARIEAQELASVLNQDADHELMGLFAWSLRDLGRHVAEEFGGRFGAVVEQASGSAVALATRLSRWDSFTDVSRYEGLAVPFLKRAQIAAADLAIAGVAEFSDVARLTMFADNLVPHVLRLDGVLDFDRGLVARIERGALIEHGSPEEVEIRACAVHAVELIVAARPMSSAADIDRLLWHRGHGQRYQAEPRHRTRCTAY
jgi:hypothetical protein